MLSPLSLNERLDDKIETTLVSVQVGKLKPVCLA